jgi:membrane-associated protease RseP (regulator of RpoE activity)
MSDGEEAGGGATDAYSDPNADADADADDADAPADADAEAPADAGDSVHRPADASAAPTADADADDPTDPAADGAAAAVPTASPAAGRAADANAIAGDRPAELAGSLARRVAAIAADLGSPRYHRRRQGSEALAELPPRALPLVLAIWRESPSAEVRRRIRYGMDEQIIAHVSADPRAGMGFLGMRLGWSAALLQVDDDLVPRGSAMVIGVLPGTQAEKAGLQASDHILTVDGQSVADFDSLEAFIDRLRQLVPGRQITMTVARGRDLVDLSITVGNRLTDTPEPVRSQFRREAIEAFWQAQREKRKR